MTVHDWPVDRSAVRTPEEAVGLPTGTGTFVEGYLVTGPGHRRRLCPQPSGTSRLNAPRLAPSAARGSQPARRTTAVHRGLMRAWVDDVTGFRRLELLTLEVTDTYDPSTAGHDDLCDLLGDTTRVTVEDGTITVPAVDIAYGQPLSPAPAGTYELVLDNHGSVQHTLVSDGLAVALHTSVAERATTTVVLTAGEHLFYCRIPGHREAGMELALQVE